MPVSAMYPSLTALQAFGRGQRNTAHNLANVNTDGFKAGMMSYADLPHMSGVAAQGPRLNQSPGPLIPHQGLPRPAGQSPSVPAGFVEGSNTDVPTEMVGLIVNSRTYQANTKVVRTVDEMLGTVIDLKV